MKLIKALCVSILVLATLTFSPGAAVFASPKGYLEAVERLLAEHPTTDCKLPFATYYETFNDEVITQSIAGGDNKTLSKILGVLTLLDQEWNYIHTNCVNHLPPDAAEFMDEQLLEIRNWIFKKKSELIEKINLRIEILSVLEPKLFLTPPIEEVLKVKPLQEYLNLKYEKPDAAFELSSILVNHPRFGLVKHRSSLEFMFRQKNPNRADPLSMEQLHSFLIFIQENGRGNHRLDALKNMGQWSSIRAMLSNCLHKDFNPNWQFSNQAPLERILTNLILPAKTQPRPAPYRAERITPALYEAILDFLSLATQDEENFQIATTALETFEETLNTLAFPHYPALEDFLKFYSELLRNKDHSEEYLFAKAVVELRKEILQTERDLENETVAIAQLRFQENSIIEQDTLGEDDLKDLSLIGQALVKKKLDYAKSHKQNLKRESLFREVKPRLLPAR